MKIDININEKYRKTVADGLSRLLADTYTLYLKTHNFHWNVTGPYFPMLHLMFETQYNELALAVDRIAERIRSLGFPAPGSYAQFSELSSIKEETGLLKAENMIVQLVEGHETIIKNVRKLFSETEESQDEATMDLLIERLESHEKTAWMLRSSL